MEMTPFFVDRMPPWKEIKLGEMYVCEQFGCVHFLCPCGCGGHTNIPLSPFWGKDGWTMENNDGKLTFSPSMLNPQCKTHFYIRNNQVEFCK